MEWDLMERRTPEYMKKVNQRSRRERWSAKGNSRVVHPAHGAVVVPHRSNLAAILNAAEVWGCPWVEILDAEVWLAAPGEKPVAPPYTL